MRFGLWFGVQCELTEGVNDNDACFRVFALTPNEVNLVSSL